MIVIDKRGRQFEVTVDPPIAFARGAVQTAWLADEKAVTLQPEEVASLAAWPDKETWPGWETHLSKIE